jgi:mRNA-degrading endonuclease toxin of MazEF toxin-antitoxin module
MPSNPKRGEIWLVNLSIDIRRFIRKLGTIPDSDMQEIAKAIVAIIEYQEVPDRA